MYIYNMQPARMINGAIFFIINRNYAYIYIFHMQPSIMINGAIFFIINRNYVYIQYATSKND